jgi:DNA processing protein
MKKWPDEKCAWLALHMTPGLGNTVFKNLLEKFGSPQVVFEADIPELLQVEGLREEIAQRIVNGKFASDPEKELRKVEKCNARIITYLTPSYPRLLKEIHYPPMLLYVKGKDIPVNQSFIAVVGSRNPTHYGLSGAEKIALGLARRGVGVASGMAKGIDSAAHRGCLRGEGFTIAVMGTGIDQVYPPSNRRLFERIVEKGAVISEFPVGSPPEPRNFPIRNRIISGLSEGVAVVEATKKSGSLITASFALDQGREVFAGAKLIENADDILEEFVFGNGSIRGDDAFKAADRMIPDMDQFEKKVYEIIGDYPMHIDQIGRLGDFDAGEVLSILMKMELKGIVKQLPGKLFVR